MKAVCFMPSARDTELKAPTFRTEGAVTVSALKGGHVAMHVPVQALCPDVSLVK